MAAELALFTITTMHGRSWFLDRSCLLRSRCRAVLPTHSPPAASMSSAFAVAPRLAVRAALRPLTRCSSSLASSNWAPWPQRQRSEQQAQRDVTAAARNRLADLLADMRAEDVEDDTSSAPVGETWPPPPLPACRLTATCTTRSPSDSPLPRHAVTKLEWQSPLGVLRYPDPRLRAQNARIGCFDESLHQLAKEMFEVMYE